MQLSKFSYYSDFVVYPITVIALTAVNFRQFTWQGGGDGSAHAWRAWCCGRCWSMSCTA